MDKYEKEDCSFAAFLIRFYKTNTAVYKYYKVTFNVRGLCMLMTVRKLL